MSDTKRILQLPVGSTPAESDQFLSVQDLSGTPVTRRLSFAVLLTLFSTLFKGAYDSATTYTVGQIVESSGSAYQCILASLNHTPPNATYWKLIVSKGGTGTAGSQWSNGSSAPSNGDGVDGDFYLRTTNDDIYKKAGGVWSIVGNFKGATGDIREWLAGSGAPSGGQDGDWYLDGTNGDVYGPKASGAWPGSPAVNIRGPQGDPGDPGAPGGSGPTGGATNTVWFKLSSTDYDGEWRIIAIGDITGLTAALAAKASTTHVTAHAPGGSDALPWTAIHGRGVTGSRPAAAAGNAGYLYFDTTLGKLQRSTGSAWEDVSETGGGGSSVTHWKEAVRVATTANITLSGTQTIDGVAVIAGDRVLAKNQTDETTRLIYVAATGAWTIAADSQVADIVSGVAVPVTAGTVNAGQVFLLTKTASTAGTWSTMTAAGAYEWRTCLANSAATLLVAFGNVVGGGAAAMIKSSTNGGTSWTDITPPGIPGSGAGAVDGAYLGGSYLIGNTILIPAIGGVYLSTDAGANWSFKATTGHTTSQVWSCSCSSDGTKIYAVCVTGSTVVLKSTNSGTSFSDVTPGSGFSSAYVALVNCSSDATKVLVSQAGAGTQGVWRSSDSAGTWTHVLTTSCMGACMSDDGTKIAAYSYTAGTIKISTDSGATWADAITTGAQRDSLACSADFTSIIAGGNGASDLIVSKDSGGTWATETLADQSFYNAVSGDGTAFYAGSESGTTGYPQKRTAGSSASYTWTNSNRTQTASRIMATDANGNITTTAAATLAELAFLAGVTSAVQTQLDAKEPVDTILTVTTTNATPTALTTIALANNTARKFTMEVVGRRTDTGSDVAGWDYSGVIKRGANAAATAIQGTAVKDDATGANPAGWDSDALADTSGGGLQPKVTGESGATINWKVRVRMTTV